MTKEEIKTAFNFLDECLSEHKFLLDLHNKGISQVDGNFSDYQTLAEGGIAINKLKAEFSRVEQEYDIEIDESLFNKDSCFAASENMKREIKNNPNLLYRKNSDT